VDLKISEVRENYCNSASSLANSEPTVGWSAATRSKSEADLKLGQKILCRLGGGGLAEIPARLLAQER
jgi:hypothetical protein